MMVPATVYTRKASTDFIHGYTVTFREIWLGPPYNICVNHASRGNMSEAQMNIFSQDKPTLTFCVSIRGGDEHATNVEQIQVSKQWADKCHQYTVMKKTMDGIAKMLEQDDTFQLLKEPLGPSDDDDQIENDDVPFMVNESDSTRVEHLD